MTAEVYQLDPHDNMTPEECLSLCARELTDLTDVIVIGFDADGDLVVRASAMARKDAVWALLMALDHARDKA